MFPAYGKKQLWARARREISAVKRGVLWLNELVSASSFSGTHLAELTYQQMDLQITQCYTWYLSICRIELCLLALSSLISRGPQAEQRYRLLMHCTPLLKFTSFKLAPSFYIMERVSIPVVIKSWKGRHPGQAIWIYIYMHSVASTFHIITVEGLGMLFQNSWGVRRKRDGEIT